MKLKLATFNIQHGVDHAIKIAEEGRIVVDLDRVADHVAKMGVDVCTFQEIYNCPPDGIFPDQPGFIAKKLGGWHSAHAKAIDVIRSDGAKRPYGNGIVSQYPIKNMRAVPLVVPAELRVEGHRYEDRVLMIAELDLGEGKTLTVMNCHFCLTDEGQKVATETILAEKEKISGPIVLTGDFNLYPDNPYALQLKAAFDDTEDYMEGSVLTFPSHSPRTKIDYIFTSGLKIEKAYTVTDIISDHLPIVAELEV